jgi:hypothetical protein
MELSWYLPMHTASPRGVANLHFAISIIASRRGMTHVVPPPRHGGANPIPFQLKPICGVLPQNRLPMNKPHGLRSIFAFVFVIFDGLQCLERLHKSAQRS